MTMSVPLVSSASSTLLIITLTTALLFGASSNATVTAAAVNNQTAAVNNTSFTNETAYQRAFVDWVREHNKSYELPALLSSYTTFKSNLDFIDAHNRIINGADDAGDADDSDDASSPRRTYTVALNHFADLTFDEFKERLSLKPQSQSVKVVAQRRMSLYQISEKAAAAAEAAAAAAANINTTLPTSVDWRARGMVNPVRNQGSCGSCWAFSSVASMEGAWAQATGQLPALSEQQLIDCVNGGANDCSNGGLMTDGFNYAISTQNISVIMSAAAYPYSATDHNTCAYTAHNGPVYLSQWSLPVGSEQALTAASAVRATVSVGIDASHQSFQFYSGGVYNEPSCSSSVDDIDHGVAVVGYGTDPIGGDYYIVRNSWAASWGENGYIRMARNAGNMCGIASMASYILTSQS